MSIIIRLENLQWSAGSADIRKFFQGLDIPEGGVHIIGGETGDAFIAFQSDEDGRLAMQKDGMRLKDNPIKLILSSHKELERVLEQIHQDCQSSVEERSTSRHSDRRRESPVRVRYRSPVRHSRDRNSSSRSFEIDRSRHNYHGESGNSRSPLSPSRYRRNQRNQKYNEGCERSRSQSSSGGRRRYERKKQEPEVKFISSDLYHHHSAVSSNTLESPEFGYSCDNVEEEADTFLKRVASIPKECDIRNSMEHRGSNPHFLHKFHPTSYGTSKGKMQIPANRNDMAEFASNRETRHDRLSHENASLKHQSYIYTPKNIESPGMDFNYTPTEDGCRNPTQDYGLLHDIQLSKPEQKPCRNNFGVELSGLSPNATYKDINVLFKNVYIPKHNILWDVNDQGCKSGVAYVCLNNEDDLQLVSSMRKLTSGGQPISMKTLSDENFYTHFSQIVRSQEKKIKRRRLTNEFCYMLKGLPFTTTEEDILNFFKGFNLTDLLILYNKNNKATGTGYVRFASWEDYNRAFEKNGKKIGHRYIELFVSSTNDIEKAKHAAVVVSKPMKDILNEQMFKARNLSLKQNGPMKRPLCATLNGLPLNVSSSDVFRFFNECGVRLNAVHVLLNEMNCPNGRAFIEFQNLFDFDEALKQHGKYLGDSIMLIKQVLFEEMLNILATNLAKHDFGIVQKPCGEVDSDSVPEKLPYIWDPPDSHPPKRRKNAKKQPSHRLPLSSTSMFGATPVISGKAFTRQGHDKKQLFEKDQLFGKLLHSGTSESQRLGNTQNLNSDVKAVKTEFYEPCEQNNGNRMMHFGNSMINTFSGHGDQYHLATTSFNSSPESYMPQESHHLVNKQCHKNQDEYSSSVPFTQPDFVKVEPIDSFKRDERNEYLFCKGQDVRKHPSFESRGYSIGRPRQVDTSGCVVQASHILSHIGLKEILHFFQDFHLTGEDVIRKYTDHGEPTGFVRIAFESPAEAQRAIRTLHKKCLGGDPIFLTLV